MAEDIYWKKYTERFRSYPALIEEPINPEVKLIVCIPVCSEPDLVKTLLSLSHCFQPDILVEIILLFNKNAWMSSGDMILHEQSWNEVLTWISSHTESWIRFLPVFVNEMPDMKGGVGWASKFAMDEAAMRLGQDGIIACLDADCTVSKNYIREISNQFIAHPLVDAASVYFEHPYQNLSQKDREAIIRYELHLRYLVHVQRWCGHPFAYQTVGSSMAVRRNAYLSQGGMNTKRAGEDFYFLQKFIETGKLFEIKSATVFPSARISNRVPFGTGKAMEEMKRHGTQWDTHSFEIFKMIKPLFQSLEILRNSLLEEIRNENVWRRIPGLDEKLVSYLIEINFTSEARLISDQTTSQSAFNKRLFRYFNAFQMIKYIHYMRDNHFPDVNVESAVCQLFIEKEYGDAVELSAEEYLIAMRKLDKMN